MSSFLLILLLLVVLFFLSILGWLCVGLMMLIGTAWFAPKRLRTTLGAFRLDVAVALVLIWPIPASLGLLRMITWPARRLTEKRSKDLDLSNVSSLSERSRAA